MSRLILIAAVAFVTGVSSVALAGPSYDRTPQRRIQLAGGRGAAPRFYHREAPKAVYALTGETRTRVESKIDRKGSFRVWRHQFIRVPGVE